GSLTNVNGMLHFMSDGTGDIDMFTRINTPQLASGKTYTLSAKVRFDEGTTGAINKLRLVYRTSPGENILLEANNTTITIDDVGKEITIKGTANVNYQITNLDRFYISVSFSNRDKINGGFKLYDIKIEEGSTATPYQPNLLDDPYWVGKTSLGKNIANKGTTFPIKSSAYEIYKGNTEEELIIGQTYTITLKGTKPASQTFVAYNYWNVNFGDLKPVEGLTDVWSLTFTPTKLEPGLPKDLRIFQSPKETAGACRIDWLKIEKGDTRTPNIEQYKYRGIGMRDSNNPKYYVWDLEPSYVENNLATDIKVAEITGKANNYTDGKVSEINSQLTASINEVDTTAKDAQTKANANETAIKSTNSRVNEIENIITALTKEETYLLPASIVSGGSLKFTSRGGMTVATGSFKLAKDIAFGEVLVNDLPDSMINIDNNAIGTGAVTGNSVSQIYVESNTRKVVANTAMKKDQWFTVGFSYHSKLSI
ncbi:TPA: hypothetical protein OOH36_002923, partial [Enterococcus faecium]|nr:hypothetical protein [Enterococcus faecium]HAQ2221790.1 hypothetical protein [Enterococcus faecium]HAQ2746451.1 hypothetical protein [Enterococcus faecium]HAQ3887854.1 hypothetical protein [Enterococcus faecium]HCR4211375.1 hypothetical protein [Enterococcus faecium]